MQLIEGRLQSAAEYPINFLTRSVEVFRVLEQEVDGERQQSTGRLVAGDQERDGLGAYVVVRKRQPCLRVDSRDHPAEQVSVVRGIAHGSALAEQIIHQAGHEGLILFNLALCADLEPGLDRQLPYSRLRL